MDRTKVEESIAELAASTGMTTKTIRIGDMSIVLGIGARKTTTTTTRQEQGGIDEELDEILSTPAPVKGEALLGHLKTFEKIARRTSIASARLGSDITRTVARRSLGDELDRAILRCAQERYESERTLHAALVKQLDLLDPQPTPRVLLESITFDQVNGHAGEGSGGVMSDVLKPRGPLSRKGLIKCLSTTLLDTAENTRASLEKNTTLLKWMAQIELPAEFERALLAGLVDSHNASRNLAMLALRNLVELDPEWAKPAHKFPPEMTIGEQYESLAKWRAKYDEAVKESQAEAEREAATEWPAARTSEP